MGKNVHNNVLTDSLLHLKHSLRLVTSVFIFLPPLCVRCTLTPGHLKPWLNKGQSSGGGAEGGVCTQTLLIWGAKVRFKVQCGNPCDDSATFHQVAQLLFNHESNILAQIRRVLRRRGRAYRQQIQDTDTEAQSSLCEILGNASFLVCSRQHRERQREKTKQSALEWPPCRSTHCYLPRG